jgi:hypothetical protein
VIYQRGDHFGGQVQSLRELDCSSYVRNMAREDAMRAGSTESNVMARKCHSVFQPACLPPEAPGADRLPHSFPLAGIIKNMKIMSYVMPEYRKIEKKHIQNIFRSRSARNYLHSDPLVALGFFSDRRRYVEGSEGGVFL